MKPRPLAERETELLGTEIVVTKLDAAKEQLDTTIQLFFKEEAPISQHTLLGAAHGVLRDVAASRGIKKSFKDSPLIAESERAGYLKAVHMPQNFFKHADKDPNNRIAFRYKLMPLLALDAIVLWVALDQELTYPMRVLLMWIQLEFPDLLSYEEAEKYLASVRETSKSSRAFLLVGRLMLEKGSKTA
jgi:hypothetical protein